MSLYSARRSVSIGKRLEMCPWDTDAPAIAKFA